MTETRYEPILLEIQTLSLKYGLGKVGRRKLDHGLKDLQERLSGEVMAQKIQAARKNAFYQGFLAALLLSCLLFALLKIVPWIVIARF